MNQFDYQRALFASFELKPNDKLVGCVIGSHYNWKTHEWAFPSNMTIAIETGLSVRSVVRAKNNLVKHGYLVSQRRFNSSNIYTPMVPKTIPMDIQSVPDVIETLPMDTESHEGCPIGQLKDTLKDNLKDKLKDTLKDNEFSNENSYDNSNTKEKPKEIITINDSDQSSLTSFKAMAADAPLEQTPENVAAWLRGEL